MSTGSPSSRPIREDGSAAAAVQPATLIECLARHAKERPYDVALLELKSGENRRVLTWEQLHESAGSVAQRLASDYPNHTVVVALPNSPETQIILLGSLWSGANTFPISPLSPAREVSRHIQRLGKCVLVAGRELTEELRSEFDGCVDAKQITRLASETGSGATDKSDAASLLLHSSGTTGLPKIVRRDMRSLTLLGQHLAQALTLTKRDRMLIAIPLCHSYGIDTALAAATVAGCEIELHDQYSPTAVRQALSEDGVTVWPGVPLMFDALSRNSQPMRVHQLRIAISAGSPLPSRVYEQFFKAFAAPIGQIYGASEFGSVFYNSPEISPFDPSSVGRPLDGVHARILDLDDPRVDMPLPLGASGEIAIRSPTMFSEYLDSIDGPDARGYLRTGDIGSLDAAGVLRITGRVKLLIDVGAQKVNPLEVEEVLGQHRSVAESVVVATPYSSTAHRLKAVVVAREGHRADPEELRTYLRNHLIGYKVPRRIEVRDTLPRSPAGKVLRNELQAEAFERGE